MTDKWKIEVHVGEPSANEVFIARPWSDTVENSEYIERNILRAIAKAGLKATDTNYKKIDDNFIRSIIKQIRKVAVVIGVCSPVQNGSEPNSNVMYELGIARSLGKPTVIIASSNIVDNGFHIGADLQGHDILTYDAFSNEQFDEKLARYLKAAVDRSDSSGLVDSNSYDDIFAVPVEIEQNQNALVIAFPIVRFTTETLRVFSLENRSLDQLDRHTQILSQLSTETERERLLQALQEIKKKWREFVSEEESVISKEIRKLLREGDEIKRAIDQLKKFPGDPVCTKLLEDLSEDITSIIKHMNNYVTKLDLLKQEINNNHESDFIIIDKKDDIAIDLNIGCSRLIEEVYRLTSLAGYAIPQTYQILDKLGGARV